MILRDENRKHCMRMGYLEYMAFCSEANYVLKATEYFLACSSNVLPDRTNP